MNERDELAGAIAWAMFGSDPQADQAHGAALGRAAAAILAAGYRKPRTVTTAAELDALPVGSVVLDRDETACQKSHDYFDREQWYAVGVEYAIARPELPATVLHEGGAA